MTAGQATTTIEDEVELLEDLDRLRIRSAVLRDEGFAALMAQPLPGRLITTDDLVEDSCHAKALIFPGAKPDPSKDSIVRNLVTKLETVDLSAILGDPADSTNRLVLRSSKIMQALVSAPQSAFSKAVLYLYYFLVRELYTAEAPDWTVGGSRAQAPGVASAYVTSECIRSILGFYRALANTGKFLAGIRTILALDQPASGIANINIPQPWAEAEQKRLSLSFFITVRSLGGNLALRLALPSNNFTPEFLEYLREVPQSVRTEVGVARANFETALEELKRYRENEEKLANSSETLKAFHRSHAAHWTALGAVAQAVERAREAEELFRQEKNPLDQLEKLSRKFSEVAEQVRKILHPAKLFVLHIIDAELATAATTERWDAAELAFAAVSHGALTGDWDDYRLRRAGDLLCAELSARGRLPIGRPYHASQELLVIFHPLAAEVYRAIAVLLERVPSVEIGPLFVRKLLDYFEKTRIELNADDTQMCGWSPESFGKPTNAFRRFTSEAVIALQRINRMLDERINLRVFRNFSVRQVNSPKLEALFTSDVGLSLAPEKAGDVPLRRNESVGILLERMRAHVLGMQPPYEGWDRLYSMVLHGPPGTGKTTLAEALAASCSAPLVEITPSDLVVAGAEAVEKRARFVFRALSLLTRAVILFDEFDPVLARRNLEETTPHSVFSFLTPGMLPKLKGLHRDTGRRRVAFFLITNIIGKLDSAAVRTGRFDVRVGIYPPDPLSRMGQLITEFLRFCDQMESPPVLPPDFQERFAVVIKRTAGLPMEFLGRRGWFLRPVSTDRKARLGTPFAFILGEDVEPFWPEPEAEEPKKVTGEGPAALQEFKQWKWIIQWDKKIQSVKLALNKEIIP